MVLHVLDNSRSDSSLLGHLRKRVVIEAADRHLEIWSHFLTLFTLQQVDGFVLTVKHVASDFNSAQVSLLSELPRCCV